MGGSPKFQMDNNQNTSANQGVQQNQKASIQRKTSPLEETLQKFIQGNFKQVNKQHETMSKNYDASIQFLEMQIGQLSHQIAVLRSSSGGFTCNTVDNPKSETCKALERRFEVITNRGEDEIVGEDLIEVE